MLISVGIFTILLPFFPLQINSCVTHGSWYGFWRNLRAGAQVHHTTGQAWRNPHGNPQGYIPSCRDGLVCSPPHGHQSCRSLRNFSLLAENEGKFKYKYLACQPPRGLTPCGWLPRREGEVAVPLEPIVLLLDLLLLSWFWNSFCWRCCLDPDFGSFVFIYAVLSQFIFENVQKWKEHHFVNSAGDREFVSFTLIGIEILLNYYCH